MRSGARGNAQPDGPADPFRWDPSLAAACPVSPAVAGCPTSGVPLNFGLAVTSLAGNLRPPGPSLGPQRNGSASLDRASRRLKNAKQKLTRTRLHSPFLVFGSNSDIPTVSQIEACGDGQNAETRAQPFGRLAVEAGTCGRYVVHTSARTRRASSAVWP